MGNPMSMFDSYFNYEYPYNDIDDIEPIPRSSKYLYKVYTIPEEEQHELDEYNDDDDECHHCCEEDFHDNLYLGLLNWTRRMSR
jgi:hypothetical protein